MISNKFTAANILARHINSFIKKIATQNNVKLSDEQIKKLEEVCYQVALDPGKDVSLPLDFKKKLINDFNDFSLITLEEDKRFENCEIKQLPAGDFIQVKQHLEAELKKLNETEQLEKLPELLVGKAETLDFTVDSDKLMEELFTELNSLPSLKNKVSKHEIAYILGVIFMDMSSIHVFGYHSDSDNTAFARFRLLGAYWLSKSLLYPNNNWTIEQKKIITREIKYAVLDTRCSGQISNLLYGTWCDKALESICTSIKNILQAKM